ncbi:hypothetical protein ACLOJK_005248, partial [Asimina triloba]
MTWQRVNCDVYTEWFAWFHKISTPTHTSSSDAQKPNVNHKLGAVRIDRITLVTRADDVNQKKANEANLVHKTHLHRRRRRHLITCAEVSEGNTHFSLVQNPNPGQKPTQ